MTRRLGLGPRPSALSGADVDRRLGVSVPGHEVSRWVRPNGQGRARRAGRGPGSRRRRIGVHCLSDSADLGASKDLRHGRDRIKLR